jgi:hypothetical protein
MKKFIIAFFVFSIGTSCWADFSSQPMDQANTKSFQEMPLKEAVLSDEVVLDWVSKHVEKIFSFNFLNIDKWRDEIKPYFSKSGYSDFISNMEKTRNLDVIKHKKLIVHPQIKANALIVTKGINKGFFKDVYTWFVLEPIQVLYLGPENQMSQNLLIKMEIVRVNNPEHSDYIVINSLQINDNDDKSMERVIEEIKKNNKLKN